jgi:hypothetical protein
MKKKTTRKATSVNSGESQRFVSKYAAGSSLMEEGRRKKEMDKFKAGQSLTSKGIKAYAKSKGYK